MSGTVRWRQLSGQPDGLAKVGSGSDCAVSLRSGLARSAASPGSGGAWIFHMRGDCPVSSGGCRGGGRSHYGMRLQSDGLIRIGFELDETWLERTARRPQSSAQGNVRANEESIAVFNERSANHSRIGEVFATMKNGIGVRTVRTNLAMSLGG